MEFTAKQIAGFVNGTIEGDDTATVNDIARIEDGKPKALSFLANPKYNQYLYETKSSIVLINKDFEPEKPVDCTLIRVDDAYTAFATILSAYQEAKIANKTGISPTAVIDPSAKIGNNCYIGEYVVIGAGTVIEENTKIYAHSYIGENVTIGKDCLIYSGVKIQDDCIIGNDCTFHAGVVIGSDGFGFAPQQDTDFKKVAQIGNVVIEDRVELGANTTVDRATIGSTIIRRGVKIDNLCQVAHNVEVGENTVMAAQSGIAGSAKVGKNCMIGGQVAITGHITVADGVKIAGKSGVSGSIRKENSIHMGMPSFDHKKAVQSFIYFKRLPEMNARIEALEKELKSMKTK